jgi:hypothetical protein
MKWVVPTSGSLHLVSGTEQAELPATTHGVTRTMEQFHEKRRIVALSELLG